MDFKLDQAFYVMGILAAIAVIYWTQQQRQQAAQPPQIVVVPDERWRPLGRPPLRRRHGH